MTHLKILSTSDVHGYVYPTGYSTPNDKRDFGFLKAATVIDTVRQEADPDDIVLTIENGDWIQGSPFAAYIAKHDDAPRDLFTQLSSAMAYDAGVLGNHEFNYGLSYLRSCEAARQYPLLGANIQGGQRAGIVDAPYTILERGGVKIAILGLTTAYIPMWEAAGHIEGLTFVSAFTTAQHWVPRLRELADVVIVAYHGGLEADPLTGDPTERLTGENEGYQLMTAVPGIDALITGHQHREIAGVYQGVPVTQPGEKGVAVGLIDLELDAHHQVVTHRAELLSTAQATPKRALQALTTATEAAVQAWLDQPIGQVTGASLVVTDSFDARLHGHPYLQFVNEVAMDAGQTDIALTSLFNDDVRGLGTHVTMRQLLNSYGYPNTLVVERLTGSALKAALERSASFFTCEGSTVKVNPAFIYPKLQLYNYDVYSGIDYTFDLHQPIGQRVVDLSYHGQPIQPDQELLIAVNQYRGNGGGDYPMFAASKIVREINVDMVALILDYFEHHPVVTGKPQTNFQVRA
ncbi:2,3-cyclic-nucleotide 2-phosphodiesterase [Levilactobacillus paucivorans]|uniref:2,3-cyclic-nucleotide 2-phosphodiesterase n=1 Tax=Levilactobacillus paucivorans TaxID=616990 RepID=A0A0R2LVT8_9LACO|nr:bifunctional metallophosphatase/5'-nucleotidase [Levilactobacillus paucivorans]KRO03728.1 2,3-cyclic-nucleotide 2-phosphodiesterase [Levilactobacillus paucivorans]